MWSHRDLRAYLTVNVGTRVHQLVRLPALLLIHVICRRDVQFLHWPEMVENVLTTLQAEFRGSHIIYRTSTWGHTTCPQISRPLNTVDEALESVHADMYHWMSPIRFEHVWMNVAKSIRLRPKMLYVNASMTLLRGDGHMGHQRDVHGNPFNDCLHYCMPGVPDYWNWILYNTLLSLDLSPPLTSAA